MSCYSVCSFFLYNPFLCTHRQRRKNTWVSTTRHDRSSPSRTKPSGINPFLPSRAAAFECFLLIAGSTSSSAVSVRTIITKNRFLFKRKKKRKKHAAWLMQLHENHREPVENGRDGWRLCIEKEGLAFCLVYGPLLSKDSWSVHKSKDGKESRTPSYSKEIQIFLFSVALSLG